MASLKDLQTTLGIHFRDETLLKQALTHPSYINENPASASADNERMEFLGDALLSLIVAEKLYHEYPDYPEGKLTEIKISLVRQEKIAEKAAALGLGEHLSLGKGEASSGGRGKQNNLADAFEALLAAVFLDQGMDATRDFIIRNYETDLQAVKSGKYAPNFKAMLQELTQAEFKRLPEYEVVESSGPDHDRKFVVAVSLGDVVFGIGSGKSKKIAESEAARIAYSKLTAKTVE